MALTDSVTRLAGTPAEIFARLLEGSAARLAPERAYALNLPDDELHREILIPLLPAMLDDKAIRQNWRDQVATGFFARLKAHVETGAAAPRWQTADFEIHVSASYLASPDAKALADTLLSEPSLRDLSATLMNQLLDIVWPTLPVAELVPEPVAPETDVSLATPAESQAVAVAEESTAPAPALEPSDAPATPIPAISPVPTLPRVLGIRRNPIHGTHHTFGGLGAPSWAARYPLRRVWFRSR